MPKTSRFPASPLATFMKGLIDSKKFDSAEIVTDNPKRLSSNSVRPLLQAAGEAQDKQKERWEHSQMNENECINCPQRRASIDDDELFSDEFSDCGSDDEDDMTGHTTSTTSTPRPCSPLSPSIGADEKIRIETNKDAALPYQMALRMVQQKYAASSLNSPTQSPIQPPKKVVPGSSVESSYRR